MGGTYLWHRGSDQEVYAMKRFAHVAILLPELLLAIVAAAFGSDKTAGPAERFLVQTGHAAPIRSWDFSSNAQHLLTRATDGQCILWDVRSGDVVRVVQDPAGPWPASTLCDISPDGAAILRSQHGQVDQARLILEEAATGRLLHILPLEGDSGPGTVKFSDDGRYVFSMQWGHPGAHFHLWDAATAECIIKPSTQPAYETPDQAGYDYSTRGNLRYFQFFKHARPDGRLLAFQGCATMCNATTGFYCPDKRRFVTRDWSDTGSAVDDTVIWNLEAAEQLWHGNEPFNEQEIFAFSPDARHFIRGIHQKAVVLMDLETCQTVRTFDGHQAKITKLAFSPDGETILSGDEQGMAIVWHVATGRQLVRIKGFGGPIRSVAYRPDGKRILASGGKQPFAVSVSVAGDSWFPIGSAGQAAFSPDGRRIVTDAAICDAETGETIRRILWTSPYRIELSPNGNWAIGVPKTPPRRYASSDGTPATPIHVWNTRTAQVVHDFHAPGDYYDASRYGEPAQPPATRTSAGDGDVKPSPFGPPPAPVGRLAPATRDVLPEIAGLDAEARQWLDGLVDDEPDRRPRGPYHTAPGYSPSGRYQVRRPSSPTRGGSPPLEILADDGQPAATLDAEPLLPTAWIFNGDETRLLAAYRGKQPERTLILWDLASGERIRTVAAPREENPAWEICALTLSPNERYAAVGVQSGYRIFLVDLETGESFSMKHEKGQNYSIAPALFSPDSKRVYCYGHRRTLWDIETQRLLADFGAYNGAYSPIFSPNGKILFVQSNVHGDALWDTQTGQIEHCFGNDGAAGLLKFSPDGRRLVPIGSGRTPPALWDFETGKPICTLALEPGGPMRDALFTPDGQKLITTHERALAIWDARSGRRLSVHEDGAFPFDFRGNIQFPFFVSQSRLVTVHATGAVLWDVEAGQPVHRFPTPSGRRTAAILEDGGKRLLSVSPGANAILWDMATGEKLQTFDAMPADVASPLGEVRLSGDGARVFARCRAGQAVIAWDVATGRIGARFYLVDGGGGWLTVYPETGRFVGATEYVRTAL